MTAAPLGIEAASDNVAIERTNLADGSVARLLPVESQLDLVQRELETVKVELDELRRRDNTLQYYMRRLDEELRLAARVQQDFLPKTMPKVSNVRFQTLFRPAQHVSGDLYDVMRLDESHVGFYMADAVGHGMPAALLTMFLKQALVTKEIFPGGYRLLEPQEAMMKLNMALVGQNLSQATFATALYGHINTRTLEVTFARGGHPNPVLLSREGELKNIEASGPLLGIFPDEPFDQASIKLHPGDRLIVYSDGVELAFSESDPPDTNRWRHELFERRALGTEQIIEQFLAAIDAAPPGQRKDDITIIAIDVERDATVQVQGGSGG